MYSYQSPSILNGDAPRKCVSFIFFDWIVDAGYCGYWMLDAGKNQKTLIFLVAGHRVF